MCPQTLNELGRISGLEPHDIPGACDQNFYHLDRRLTVLESEFSYVKEWCGETKGRLITIENVATEIKDCVKPQLAEFRAKIENLETQTPKGNNGNGNGLPNKKTIILIIVVAAISSGFASAGSGKILEFLGKFMGVN